MDSPGGQDKNIVTEEQFRTSYPHVSILPSKKSNVDLDRLTPKNSQLKASVVMTKNQVAIKLQASPKSSMNLRPTNSGAVKATSPVTKSPAPATPKPPAGAKTTVPVKTPGPSKTPVVCNSPAVANLRSPAVSKTPVSKLSVVVKTPASPVKVLTTHASPVAKHPQAGVRATPAKLPPHQTKLASATPTLPKTPQSTVKPQQTPNLMNIQTKPAVSVSNKNNSDQPNIKVLNFNLPKNNTPQRSFNQITLESVQSPTVDPANRILLQQFIKNSQLIVDSKEGSAETNLQSIVIGTTTQTVAPPPSVPYECTAAEPKQATQVSQQVTLFGPKGHTLTVSDAKKQFNNLNTMTNVVSSTTNPIPVPPPPPPPPPPPATIAAEVEAKKVQAQARVQGSAPESPVRHSQRNALQRTRQYQSTRGQVKKVSPKRGIPTQKVQPLQPPPMPPAELQPFANEEEVVTTSEVMTQSPLVTVVVVLPEGQKKTIHIHGAVPVELTVHDLLDKVNSNDLENVGDVVHVRFPDPVASLRPEPGEILGLRDGLEPGEIETELVEDGLQSEFVEESAEDLKDSESTPIYQDGMLAVCQLCGYTSIDFNNCQRCKRKLPPDCKTVPADLEVNSRKTKADSLTGDSPRKKRPKRRVDEPVCLTILSDDEDLLGLRNLSDDNFHSDTSSHSIMSSCDKEPVITNDMIIEMKQSISGGGVGTEDILDKLDESEKTYLQCRTVRIGSYKTVPKDKVLITPYGIKVNVAVLNSPAEFVELQILHSEIIKVLIHFGRQMPVLFFYTRPAAAAKIRKALRMEDKKDYYYDTMSHDETHKRITFLPDKIDDDCKEKLKTIFNNEPEKNLFAELSGKEANDILVKASPKEVQAFIKKKQPQPVKPDQPLQQPQPLQLQQQLQQSFNGQNIQTIMVYPPPPEKGGIPINTEDYACLDEDQFLNDVIIDFYLKYVVEKTLNPEDRARTHVFSSFFYKRLTTKPPSKRKSMNPVENDPASTPAQKRHSRVKSWTKNVDLFSKDYVVIPINENSHWFLAIICYPGLTGPVRKDDGTPIEVPGKKNKKQNDDKAGMGLLSGKQTVTIGSTTITAVAQPPCLDVPDDLEDRDEADGEDEDMDVPDEEEEARGMPDIKEEPEEEPVPVKKQPRVPIKQPCILIFDSLAGASRARVVATLRDYLRVEYEVRHGEGRDFSGEVMKGSNVRCPQQTNYTDCGLYVLQYVEAFFQWPILDYHIPIKQLVDWFQADIVSRKRYEIQQLLHRLMQEQNIDVEALNLPVLSLKPGGYSNDNDEMDEEEEEDGMCDEEEEDEEEDGEDPCYPEPGEDPDNMYGQDEDEEYMQDEMDHIDHEMEEDDFGMNEEDELEDEMDEEDKELDDISSLHGGTGKRKVDLKHYRIPRLRKENMNDDM